MNDEALEKAKIWADNLVNEAISHTRPIADKRNQLLVGKFERVLDAFKEEKVGPHHFSSSSGYAHSDEARDTIDRVFARVLGTESAAVRLQFVSGTHAIAASLFGVLRPGDRFISITGKPYDTLEEVIGLRGKGKGSLLEFGVLYEEISFLENGKIDFSALENALQKETRLVFIQRSCGYSCRPSLSIDLIQEICSYIHSRQSNCVCFVDNCYGEFVEDKEPSHVGADLIAGSLIKNLGGTIVPTGGYVAGKSCLVEKACSRLTCPGIGKEGGVNFHLNRLILQGLFLSPQMVTEALNGADIISILFQNLGFKVSPTVDQPRRDLIQCIRFNNPKTLEIICNSFQSSSPIGAYLKPIPSSTPGYETDLIMAGGTFVEGSTSEFSADAPLRSPYNLFVQGGTHQVHIQIALKRVLLELASKGILAIPSPLM
tara:strand:+ start:955 stop:2244 length:1290 start_codon:yes stop_codon:yes gene_type:complete